MREDLDSRGEVVGEERRVTAAERPELQGVDRRLLLLLRSSTCEQLPSHGFNVHNDTGGHPYFLLLRVRISSPHFLQYL